MSEAIAVMLSRLPRASARFLAPEAPAPLGEHDAGSPTTPACRPGTPAAPLTLDGVTIIGVDHHVALVRRDFVHSDRSWFPSRATRIAPSVI